VLAEITAAGRSLSEVATQRLNEQVFATVPGSAASQRDIYAALKEMRHAFGDFR
jgi:hypothetical protein